MKNLYILLLLLSTPILAFEDFQEVGDFSINQNIDAMRSFEIQWENFLFYTLNVDTPGFIETGAFNSRMKDKSIDAKDFFRWRAGPIVETNRDLDFYVDASSRGFFVIQLPTTIAFTRDGQFRLNRKRKLVTIRGGYPVLGENGEIVFPDGTDISVTRSGLIFVNGDEVDRLKIAVFKNSKDMRYCESLNGTVFVLRKAVEFLSGYDHYAVIQGAVEKSNVLKAIVGDIATAKHSYEANAKIARLLTKTMGSSVQMANPN